MYALHNYNNYFILLNFSKIMQSLFLLNIDKDFPWELKSTVNLIRLYKE